jgi:hypothetical protein
VHAVARNPVLAVAILAAAFGTVAVFTFAKPEHRDRYQSEMVDFSSREYHSPDSVRRSFLAHGIDLRYRTQFSDFQSLSNVRTWTASDLQVQVAPRRGRGSWGPKLERYDERFDNVLVTYGGTDEHLLRRVRAAVADLR